jgi:magnesium transporter
MSHPLKLPALTALFPPDSAGRVMITDVPVFNETTRVREAQQAIIEGVRDYESINYIYAVNDDGQLRGVLSVRELLQAKPQTYLTSVMAKDVVSASPLDTVPQVALLALGHNLKMIPILDHEKRLIGAFSSNELLDILNKEFSDDLLRLSGVSIPKQHHSFRSLRIVRTRLPWMIIGLFGGLITGSIIGAFRDSIQAMVLLVVFIPVIMSSGATSANQSAMIFIRNLLHADIKNKVQYFFNELKVSTLLAVCLSSILFVFILLVWGDLPLAVAVAASIFFTVIAGAVIGVLTPMALYRYKQDPSIGAGPFLTLLKDIVAMSIYFTVATTILSLWNP